MPWRRLYFLRSFKRLRAWVGPMAATCGWTFGGTAMIPIGYERLRRSWSACKPTLFWQPRPRRLLPSSGRLARSQLFLWATPSPAASSSTVRVGISLDSATSKPRWEASDIPTRTVDDDAAGDGVAHKNNWDRASLPLDGNSRRGRGCQNNVGLQADQLLRKRSYPIGIIAVPPNVHPHVAAIGPTQARKRLNERRK